MEEAEGVLSCLVKWHLMLILASLLRKGTNAFMNPLVAIDLGLFRRHRGGGDNAIDVLLRRVVSLAECHGRCEMMGELAKARYLYGVRSLFGSLSTQLPLLMLGPQTPTPHVPLI